MTDSFPIDKSASWRAFGLTSSFAMNVPSVGNSPPNAGLFSVFCDAFKVSSPAEWSRSKRVKEDRKSTRLNSSHVKSSYAVFCLKKKERHKNSSEGGVIQ